MTRSLKTEYRLEAGNYVYKFVENYQLSKINLKEARDNPMRLIRKLDQNRVANMAVDMEGGAPFEAIVVFDLDQQFDQLATGMHRAEAAELARIKHLDCYVVVEPDELRRDILMDTLNNIEGMANTQEENLALAMNLMRKHDIKKATEVCRDYGIKPEILTTYRKVVEFEERCDNLKLTTLMVANERHFPQTVKLQLARLEDDDVLTRAVQGIVNMNLRGERTMGFIHDILNCKGDMNRLKFIVESEEAYDEQRERDKAAFGKVSRDIPTRLMSRIKSLVNFIGRRNVKKLHLAALEPTGLSRSIINVDSLMESLVQIKAELVRLMKENERKEKMRMKPVNGTIHTPDGPAPMSAKGRKEEE